MTLLSTVTAMVLREAGWHPGRKVDPTRWLESVDWSGYPRFPALEHVLEEFGGLSLDTRPFERSPFFLSTHQQVVLPAWSVNPFMEFMPGNAEATMIEESAAWQSLAYVQREMVAIAPLGTVFLPHYTLPATLFILSDGRVCSGRKYLMEATTTVPALVFLGQTIADAINGLLNRRLGYC